MLIHLKNMHYLLIAILAFTIIQPAFGMEKHTKTILPSKQKKKRRNKLNRMLRNAIQKKDISLIRAFLEQGANPNTKDVNGTTALHVAAKKHSIELCKSLLERGANVNAQDNDGGYTPLIQAITIGTEAVCELLIAHGADVNIANIYGDTPLLGACRCHDGKVTLRKLLLDNGADIRAQSMRGNAPLKVSILKIEEMEILITHARFYPYYSPKQLRKAQQLTRMRIWAMRRVSPQFLTKDILEMILAFEPDIWRDACATPLKLHTKKYNRIAQLALPVLRTLLKNNALDTKKTIDILFKFRRIQIEQLTHDSLKNGSLTIKEYLAQILQQEDLPGKIEDVILADLGLKNSGWLSSCNVQ